MNILSNKSTKVDMNMSYEWNIASQLQALKEPDIFKQVIQTLIEREHIQEDGSVKTGLDLMGCTELREANSFPEELIWRLDELIELLYTWRVTFSHIAELFDIPEYDYENASMSPDIAFNILQLHKYWSINIKPVDTESLKFKYSVATHLLK